MLVSAEMRWFWLEDCPANLRRWFDELGPAPGEESRIDEYLSQPNETEIGIKKRGGYPGVEIKGLVATCRSEQVSLAPNFELWCKWSLRTSALEMPNNVITRKMRWLRKYDASGAAVVEIPLQADGSPVAGRPPPEQSCNVEITKIEIADDPRQWWTLGFEAFGGLESAPRNLRRTAQFLIDQSLPRPISGEFLNYPSWLARIKPCGSGDA